MSFGGPIAHLGYFHDEFVRRRQWLSEQDYADCVSLAQFLPGPSSSQVGFAIGARRRGLWGGVAAWCGFTLPSAMLMAAAATALISANVEVASQWLRGISLMTLAVVVHALWYMARTFWGTRVSLAIGLVSALYLWWHQGVVAQFLVLLGGGLLGALLLKTQQELKQNVEASSLSQVLSSYRPTVVGVLLFALLLLMSLSGGASTSDDLWRFALRFYRIGATVFGGGHVVLPLLSTEFVQSGEMSVSQFETLYGLAQALPGPLFAVASGIGVILAPKASIAYAAAAVVAMFLPGVLLMASLRPVWQTIRNNALLSKWATGVNAASVALLVSVFFNSNLVTVVVSWREVLFTLVVLGILVKKVMPNWLLVPLSAVVGHYVF